MAWIKAVWFDHMKISQFVAGMSVGDAITNYVFSLDAMMKKWPGVESQIFYIEQHVPVALKGRGLSYVKYREHSSSENIVVLHFANGSELAPFIAQLPDKKVMIYHNITPGQYFKSISDERVLIQEQGREQLKSLAAIFDLALGVSDYNRKELVDFGFKNTGVLPLILDDELLNVKPSNKVLQANRDNLKNIICVGRIAPNKRIEDILKVMYYIQRTSNVPHRLFLVGSFGGMERYRLFLLNLIQDLRLHRVVWCGHISQADLVAYYKIAHVFFTMSAHEGFCMPLIEAMRFGVPVLARDISAIGETLGGQGVLFQGLDYRRIAELLILMMENEPWRQQIIQNQKKRIERFSYSRIEQEWLSWIKKVSPTAS